MEINFNFEYPEEEDIKKAIKIIHEFYYRGVEKEEIVLLHRCMECLFNFADIEETLADSIKDCDPKKQPTISELLSKEHFKEH